MAAARGPENDELMGEIRGIAAALGWPAGVLQTFQLLYELQVWTAVPCSAVAVLVWFGWNELLDQLIAPLNRLRRST